MNNLQQNLDSLGHHVAEGIRSRMVSTVGKHDKTGRDPHNSSRSREKHTPFGGNSEMPTSPVVHGACSANRSVIGSALR